VSRLCFAKRSSRVVRNAGPLERKLLALRFDGIHDEVGREGTFLVSCSHFTDQFGRAMDLDFLLLPKEGGFVTTQAIVDD